MIRTRQALGMHDLDHRTPGERSDTSGEPPFGSYLRAEYARSQALVNVRICRLRRALGLPEMLSSGWRLTGPRCIGMLVK
jgi:hypothetical protein